METNPMTAPETTKPDVDAAIAAYCAALTASHKARCERDHPGAPFLAAETFTAMAGGKVYVRVVHNDSTGAARSVHCFVERATGLIWKADGWKKPAKNFPRGSVYVLEPLPFARGAS